MPYIKKNERKLFEDDINNLSHFITDAGRLNYVITKLCHGYIDKKGKCYSVLNEVHGVLNCADKELYRMVTAPYEDVKINENGDV